MTKLPKRIIVNLISMVLNRASRIIWDLRNKNFLVIFNFHQASDVFNAQCNYPGAWSNISVLEQSILYIKKNFCLTKLHDGICSLRENKLYGPLAAITFDDGHISIQENIFPILEKYQIPATFFINSECIGNRVASWDFTFNYLIHSEKPENRALITGELRHVFPQLRHTMDGEFYRKFTRRINELSHVVEASLFVEKEFLMSLNPKLFSVGLHGSEHHRFSMMSAHWQRESIEKDMDFMKNIPSYQPIFALPFGTNIDWNRETIKAILDLDLEILFANGGINLVSNVGIQRISADNAKISELFNSEKIYGSMRSM